VPVAGFQHRLGEQASIAAHCAHVPDFMFCTVFLIPKDIIPNNLQVLLTRFTQSQAFAAWLCARLTIQFGHLMLNQKRAERTQTTLESDILSCPQ
jgi:hypothetical protein